MTTEHAHTSPAKATAKCPFSHIQSKDAPPVSHDSVHSVRDSTSNGYAVKPSDEFARQGICPFPHASAAAASQTSADPATCPMGYGPQPSTAEAPQTAQCPMGFSSADGPRMTEFHCVICKSLLYDTVQLGCSCRYCRHCVAAYNDCPLCGADISSRTPDPKLQGTVDQYIDAHAGTHDLFDLGKTGSDVKVNKPSQKSRIAFLLQLAVRSASGGNYRAAISRLYMCKAELLKQVGMIGYTTALSSQLGAVCGSQGDCHRQLGEPEVAQGCYESGVQHLLQASQPQDAEITHPLSVTYNKLGDLEYGLGNVEAAEGWYQQGLSVRQGALDSTLTPEASQQLDVVVSMIKVADANQALGRDEQAHESFTKALQLVHQVQQQDRKDTATSDKCESLLAFLKSRQQ